jgi:hypothetical protein
MAHLNSVCYLAALGGPFGSSSRTTATCISGSEANLPPFGRGLNRGRYGERVLVVVWSQWCPLVLLDPPRQGLKIHVAKREHRCSICRRFAVGGAIVSAAPKNEFEQLLKSQCSLSE